ncbi:hypothetical protein [uncultured Prevotella sp.]|jgi:hypothetical protein|uniref:hypothetical protein n=1 Tax=uncultured Prevotella sp. TaxID=159272 RepID=UPI0026090265|nr:hypothetical protein [uncultured Prevotella sp.]
MENKNKNILTEQEKCFYSKDSFFKLLLLETERDDNNFERYKQLQRDFLYKIKVLQTILFLKVPDLALSGNWIEAERDKELIESKVLSDELLFGYTFHVSSNSEFQYTWNYMRKQLDKYVDFLFGTKRFFEFVFSDITALDHVLRDIKDIHIVFNELIDVSYTDDAPYINARMLWENFHNLANVGHNYRMSIMIKASTLMVCNCSYKDGTDNLCEKVKNVMTNFGLLKNGENGKVYNQG